MTKYTLTVLDTTGIQNYIFGSNNLQHNVGASGLVHCATHDWVFDELIDLEKTNVKNNYDIDSKVTIENGSLNSELVYAGGGNAVIVFCENELAIEFTKHLTCKVLLEAPGLQLVIAHTEFDWDIETLKEVILNTTRNVNKKKHNRNFSNPVLGLGVTADCQYTGLPAVDICPESESNSEKEVRISSEVAAKRKFFKFANKRLHDMFPLDGLEYVSNFNDFGTKHESSYIAVVHTDGNNMGKRVWTITNQYSADNREYINKIRAFSESVENRTKKALEASIIHLKKSIDEKNDKIGNEIEIHDNKLPFRPIVFGGDDVTFVCDGRLGLTLTELYLDKLTSQDSKLSDDKPISARAGIAIVKSHYPFSRAVTLADNLAKSAKNYIKERQKTSDKNDISAIDWHFAASGPTGDIDDIRKREYTGQFDPESKLYMRPVRLGKSVGSDWHSWDTFTSIIGEFQENWSDKRNKLMDLREALRAGPEIVEQFVRAYEPHKLPKISGNSASSRTGWVDKQCTCFDAIEAMDFFIPLKGDCGK